MPENWAFDQFGSTKVNGVEFDKVGASGRDTGVSGLGDTESVSDNERLASAVRSKICDFQEDIPILGLLPNLTIEREWSYTIVDAGNIKIEYAVAVGVTDSRGNGDLTFSITAGTVNDEGKKNSRLRSQR